MKEVIQTYKLMKNELKQISTGLNSIKPITHEYDKK
jgi:hypothetical protein